MKGLDSKEIVSGIRATRSEREHILRQLYNNVALRGAIMRMLLRNNGTNDDYDNIISETLTRFYKICITKQNFELKTNYINYLVGIAHFVWIGELNVTSKHKSEPLSEEIELVEEMVEVEFLNKERRSLINELLEKLGKNCKEVLMFWSSGYTMVEIAKKMNYKSPGMAKKKKHVCIKEMYVFLENNPKTLEELR